jgi:hypothetical protein
VALSLGFLVLHYQNVAGITTDKCCESGKRACSSTVFGYLELKSLGGAACVLLYHPSNARLPCSIPYHQFLEFLSVSVCVRTRLRLCTHFVIFQLVCSCRACWFFCLRYGTSIDCACSAARSGRTHVWHSTRLQLSEVASALTLISRLGV